MPVYIRKNVSYTPPSLYNMQLEDDTDFLLDPDQLRDVLPQPYRMINKLLDQLLDGVWEICEAKENAILEEARKVRPPRLEGPVELEVFKNATALEASGDGKLIFVGLPTGLGVLDSSTHEAVAEWTEEHAEITHIFTRVIAPEAHCILTVDDMAVTRLFIYAYSKITFIKTLNENPPESTSRVLCQKCDISRDGDYAGIVLENTGLGEMWLEVHKLPVDAWQKELEAITAAVAKQREEEVKQKEAAELADNEETEEKAHHPDTEAEPISNIIESSGIKFSQPNVILKVKPPSPITTPNTSSSVASALAKVDAGDVLGHGAGHLLTPAHLDGRQMMFKHKHEAQMKYLPTARPHEPQPATFHFVNVSRLLAFGLESNTPVTRTSAVIVWWPGYPSLSQYSLFRTGGKDLEYKADVVWPLGWAVTCSAVSPCLTHLALGLENGTLMLWDRQLGLDKAVISVSDSSPLRSLRFLDPALFPWEAPHYPPYQTGGATFLLAECSDGSQALFDTCDGSQQIPRNIANKPTNDDEIQTLLKIIPDLPELVLFVQKNGAMYIKDVGTGAALCQISIPPALNLQSPWEPVFALGRGGNYLYVKAEGMEEAEDGDSIDISTLLVYDLRSYPQLESYWSRELTPRPLAVYPSREERVDALMQERLAQQALRKPRMQARWAGLRAELAVIQQACQVPTDSLRLEF